MQQVVLFFIGHQLVEHPCSDLLLRKQNLSDELRALGVFSQRRPGVFCYPIVAPALTASRKAQDKRTKNKVCEEGEAGTFFFQIERKKWILYNSLWVSIHSELKAARRTGVTS